MKKKHVPILWIAFIILSALIILQNTLIIFYASTDDTLTGQASKGYVDLCVNSPPYYLNPISCNTAYTGSLYTCNLSALDDTTNQNSQYTVQIISGNTNNSGLFSNISSDGIMGFTANNTHVGNYTLNLTVLDDPSCPQYTYKTFNLTIEYGNNNPLLLVNIPDSNWSQDTLLIPYNLNSYFTDPDGDLLTYSVSGNTQIAVTIKTTGEVTLNPAPGFCGTEIIYYKATDPTNLSATSNAVTLNVLCNDQSSSSSTTSGGGGGGGGGGGSSGSSKGSGTCKESYFCYDWSSCQWTKAVSAANDTYSLNITSVGGSKVYLIDDTDLDSNISLFYEGFKWRDCVDTNKCSTYEKTYVRSCDYVPSCDDGIQNQNEEGIDCGGVCSPCGTCDDGIQNRGEEGIDCGGDYCEPCYTCFDGIMNGNELAVDCGGPDCDACPSCFDGVQNHGELGVDCGGPCASCPQEEEPANIISRLNLWPLVFIVLSLGVVLAFIMLLRNAIKRIMRILALKHKRKNRVVILDEDAKTSIIKALLSIEKRLDKEPVLKLQEELSAVVRRYFKSAFKLDYEFTYKELMQALETQGVLPLLRDILGLFFTRSSRLEFSGVKVDKEVLRALIAETRELVYQTAVLTIDDIKERDKDLTLREIPPHVSESVALYLRLLNAHIALQYKRVLLAVTLYEQIQEIYARSPLSLQHKSYDDIYRLYLEIMLLEQQKNKFGFMH